MEIIPISVVKRDHHSFPGYRTPLAAGDERGQGKRLRVFFEHFQVLAAIARTDRLFEWIGQDLANAMVIQNNRRWKDAVLQPSPTMQQSANSSGYHSKSLAVETSF